MLPVRRIAVWVTVSTALGGASVNAAEFTREPIGSTRMIVAPNQVWILHLAKSGSRVMKTRVYTDRAAAYRARKHYLSLPGYRAWITHHVRKSD